MYKLILSGLMLLSLGACKSYKYGSEGPTEKSNLTMGVVKSRILKGETTQDEILKLFGSPNQDRCKIMLIFSDRLFLLFFAVFSDLDSEI